MHSPVLHEIFYFLPPALAPAWAVVSFTLELPCTWPAPPETSPLAPSPLSASIPGCQYAPCWPACAGGPCPAAPPLPLMLRLCLEAVLHWLLSSCMPLLQAEAASSTTAPTSASCCPPRPGAGAGAVPLGQ